MFFISQASTQIPMKDSCLCLLTHMLIRTYLFVPSLDKDAAMQVSDITTIIPISDEQIPFEVVRESIGELSKTVGIEAKVLSYHLYNSLLEFFPGVEVVDVQPFINKQRMKKSKEEIAKLMTAIRNH